MKITNIRQISEKTNCNVRNPNSNNGIVYANIPKAKESFFLKNNIIVSIIIIIEQIIVK